MSVINHNDAISKITKYLSHDWDKLATTIDILIKSNPHKDKQCHQYMMWQEQAGINFPLLYLASIYLYIYAKQKGCNIFLFATRDCCHWSKIFKKLFPETTVHYFNCSRNMFGKATRENHPDFNNYVEEITGMHPRDAVDAVAHNKDDISKAIYVDIHGSGLHLFRYFRKRFPTMPQCFLLSSGIRSYSDMPSLCRKYRDNLINVVFDVNGGPIEMLNYDLVGTLQDYSKQHGPIRDKPEYDLEIVQPYHQCMNFIVEHLVPIKDLSSFTEDRYKDLSKCIEDIYSVIIVGRPIIREYIKHIGRHKKIKVNKVDKPKKSKEIKNR